VTVSAAAPVSPTPDPQVPARPDAAADEQHPADQAEAAPACRRPGRPRERRVDRAIIAATLEIFADEGYHALSMESVAARAGVGKATIYRRWPGKKELVIDALATLNDDLLAARQQLPERTVDRIRAILRHLATRDTDSLAGRILPRMVVYSVSQPDLYEEYFQRVITPRRQWLYGILREGVRRGELRPDLDVEVAALAIVGPTMMPTRGLGTDPRGRDLADRVFAVLWPGLAGPGTPAPADRVSE